MKKFFNIAMFAVVAAATLVSCNREIEKSLVEENDGIQVSVIAEQVQTKTALSGSKSIVWSASDKVGFINGSDGVNVESTTAVIDGEGKATFTGTVPSAGTYYAYYPYFADGSYAPDAEGVTVRLQNNQYPTATSFDPKADLMVSTGFAATGSTDTPSTIEFKRLGAFIRVQFVDKTTGTVLSGEHASLVSIEHSDNKICGRLKISGTNGLVDPNSGYKKVSAHYEGDAFELTADGEYAFFGVKPVSLATGTTLTITAKTDNYNITKTITLTSDIVLGAGDIQPLKINLADANVAAKTLQIATVWEKKSTGSTAWNTYYGGTAGTDRNIAMDDDYVYIAENSGTAKLWAINRTDATDVKAVNVTGVTGGTHLLACPRIFPNTDPLINGGKDVLICSNLTRGGEEPKLYLWLDGIDSAPTAMTLVTSATGAWYGDVFTVYGTLQNGILLFDKVGGTDANGIVTFNFTGTVGAKNYLSKRVKFNDAFGSHNNPCAYYPFPGTIGEGIYSPGRSTEARGQSAVVTGDFFADGNAAFTVALTGLGYAEGRNGFVLGYNYIEWKGKRYVIYGKQPNKTQGYVYVLEGSSATTWSSIASTAEVRFRRDMVREEGCSLESANSGMDVTARVIDGEVYIAVQKQNIGCAVYKLFYD